MEPTIQVQQLSKCYKIGHRSAPRYRAIRDELVETIKAPLRRLSGRGKDVPPEEFWALKDINFHVDPGDVVGIVGANGAGKSTLLKVLSRITEPTQGRVVLNGRVASLLEVGTGFHPELTGRENIYLNGTILGMSRAEIHRKFDEIVAFAEVERFLDTPVKRYSSGMYVRLAFAVAAHLEPEILIVDEVLAVGDSQFQRKCLGKLETVSRTEGRTVLFVSHQLGTVRQLCKRGLLLRSGQLIHTGTADEVVDAYTRTQSEGSHLGYKASPAARIRELHVSSAQASTPEGDAVGTYLHHQPITLEIECHIEHWVPNAEIRLIVGDSRGRRVFTSETDLPRPSSTPARVRCKAQLPGNFLRPEHYFVSISLFVNNQHVIESLHDSFAFQVQDGGSKYAASEGTDYGCVFAPCAWESSVVGTEASAEK
jgi:lipopolysaccharide transport system ATP-binding protein